jgi:hypothetical protein
VVPTAAGSWRVFERCTARALWCLKLRGAAGGHLAPGCTLDATSRAGLAGMLLMLTQISLGMAVKTTLRCLEFSAKTGRFSTDDLDPTSRQTLATGLYVLMASTAMGGCRS